LLVTNVNISQNGNLMTGKKVQEEKYYPEREFGGYSRVDGTIAFFGRVQSLLRPEMVALDVGCGRGEVVDRLNTQPWEKCRVLKGACKKVIGIDVTEAGRQNVLIDEFRLIEGGRWPVDSASIDLLMADAVLEHLTDPDAFFAECSRVVKPGGYVCFRTPNKWAYYALIASLIPNRLHAKVLDKVQPGRKEEDVFPTYYRANTIHSLNRLLAAHHFKGCVYRHIAEPSYFMFSQLAYGMGVYLHRWLPQLFWFTLFVFARRVEDERI
jgi:2-polyprenyl-3-methyl-5-hydroxy-6-metoxy-1,4-benzoquinol methylase